MKRNRNGSHDAHPRSRQRLKSALRGLALASRASAKADPRPRPGSKERLVMGIVGAWMEVHLRSKPEPEPVPPVAMAFRLACDEVIRAIEARARVVDGFDDYEAEWILGEARKAVESL